MPQGHDQGGLILDQCDEVSPDGPPPTSLRRPGRPAFWRPPRRRSDRRESWRSRHSRQRLACCHAPRTAGPPERALRSLRRRWASRAKGTVPPPQAPFSVWSWPAGRSSNTAPCRPLPRMQGNGHRRPCHTGYVRASCAPYGGLASTRTDQRPVMATPSAARSARRPMSGIGCAPAGDLGVGPAGWCRLPGDVEFVRAAPVAVDGGLPSCPSSGSTAWQ